MLHFMVYCAALYRCRIYVFRCTKVCYMFHAVFAYQKASYLLKGSKDVDFIYDIYSKHFFCICKYITITLVVSPHLANINWF